MEGTDQQPPNGGDVVMVVMDELMADPVSPSFPQKLADATLTTKRLPRRTSVTTSQQGQAPAWGSGQ